jgi:hypothetical protein
MSLPTRRQFMKSAAAASALSAASIPAVHAAGDDLVQGALIGCGGRGTGAAEDFLATNSRQGPVRLVAMADVFDHKLKGSFRYLQDKGGSLVDVPEDRKFIGFDGYKKAMDCLKKGDVAIFTSPPAFRWVFFKYAIEKGLNVFLEKPVTVDGPTSKRMLQLNEEAVRKNLKVGVGLMVRHCRGRMELEKRIRDGQIGDIVAMRAYRIHPGGGSAFSEPKADGDKTELLYQIRRFHSFLWASGGLFSDFYIHQIDETCWMKGAWPVKAQGLGGRHYRGNAVDQNFDSYSVEYTFADGTKLFYYGAHYPGCINKFASYVHGSKGSAVVSTASHTPGRVRIWKGQDTEGDAKPEWAFPQPEPNPYRMEWEDLMEAIRKDKPYNEVKRGVEASLVTSMGRMAAHTGQTITYDQMLNCPHEFAPGAETLTMDSPAPLQAGKDGKYPVPQPGTLKDREY